MKKKIFYKIFIILIIYVLLFPYNIACAATAAEVGLYVASYTKNFCEKYTIEYNGASGRYGVLEGNIFRSDCVSFVRTMYMDAVGYGVKDNNDEIVVPSGNEGKYNDPPDAKEGGSDRFEFIGYDDLSLAKPGDIITNYHHDMIFIGEVNGIKNVIANNGKNSNSSGLKNGLFTMNEYNHSNSAFLGHENMNSGTDGCHFRIWRIKEDVAKGLDKSNFKSEGDLVPDVNISKTTSTSNIEMADFYYHGIPDGKYSVTKGFLQRFIEAFLAVLDYLVGIITMSVRMVFVGWTAIIENLITGTVQSITGEEDFETISVTSTDIDSGDNITIEKIVFNQISVFDVNFFNYN